MPLRVDARLRRHIPEVCFGLPCRAQHQPRGCGPGGPGWPLRQAALHGSLLQGQRGPHAQCPVGPRAAPAAGPEPLHPGPGRVAGLQRLRWVGSPSFQHACGPWGVREDTGSAEGCRRCPASAGPREAVGARSAPDYVGAPRPSEGSPCDPKIVCRLRQPQCLLFQKSVLLSGQISPSSSFP